MSIYVIGDIVKIVSGNYRNKTGVIEGVDDIKGRCDVFIPDIGYNIVVKQSSLVVCHEEKNSYMY